eukprot:CAMPEP_0116009114 /NCGR_PEP_ID=MMETSP0321-20121206/3250_1 /TAXON_ID=163516 /ORGANISM="Leptocylindrus danicus var. danicus, Strain B650" /LENGTH=98 /DNA_ID=CAMNT_0003478035 /DNA_START=51 /DNA_END=345 /DNA_ORIENTATION=+
MTKELLLYREAPPSSKRRRCEQVEYEDDIDNDENTEILVISAIRCDVGRGETGPNDSIRASSLAIKNDFIDVRDLGNLACVSPGLRKYICVDSDDDIW